MKRIEEIDKHLVRAGDTIMFNGTEKTVCKKDITYCQFMGKSIFGYNFRSGYEKVRRVVYPVWYKGKIVNS